MSGLEWALIILGVLIIGGIVLLVAADSKKKERFKAAKKEAETKLPKLDDKSAKSSGKLEARPAVPVSREWENRSETKVQNMTKLIQDEQQALFGTQVPYDRTRTESKVKEAKSPYKRMGSSHSFKYTTNLDTSIYDDQIAEIESIASKSIKTYDYEGERQEQEKLQAKRNVDAVKQQKPVSEQVHELSNDMKALLFTDMLKRRDGKDEK